MIEGCTTRGRNAKAACGKEFFFLTNEEALFFCTECGGSEDGRQQMLSQLVLLRAFVSNAQGRLVSFLHGPGFRRRMAATTEATAIAVTNRPVTVMAHQLVTRDSTIKSMSAKRQNLM